MPDGNLYCKTEVYRAAVSLTLLDYCADMFPAYAGNMRVVVGGMIDTDEEKEWLRELRGWRATNLPTAPSNSGDVREPETIVDEVYLMRCVVRQR